MLSITAASAAGRAAVAIGDTHVEPLNLYVAPVLPPGERKAPRLDEFALRYLAEDTSLLAQTTQADRKAILRPDGPVLRSLGARRLDAITPPVLREWWNAEVTARGRSTKTGRNHLDAISKVLGYAVELGLIEASPVSTFREALRRHGRTKSGSGGL